MPLYGRAPLQVTFTDTSTPEDVTYWHWDFGDGNTSEEQNPVHMYNSVGEYTVTLNIASPRGIDTFTDVVHATGLLSLWKLEEASGTRADAIGNNDLTDINSTGSVAGVDGDAADFVAASLNYLEGGLVDIGGTSGFSAAFLVKLTTKSNFEHLIGVDDGASGRSFAVFAGAAGQVAVQAFDPAGNDISATINVALSDTTVWHFVCARWDPSDGKVKLYHNSAVLGPNTAESAGTLASLAEPDVPLRLGWLNSTYYMDGALDEVRLYNTAITDAEIDALYALWSL